MSDESALRRVRPLWLVVPAAALLIVAWATTLVDSTCGQGYPDCTIVPLLPDWAILLIWMAWALIALVSVARAFGLLPRRRR